MFRPRLIGVIYIVIGVAVAASNDYFERLNTLRRVVSALLAVALWPLVLLGIDLHIKK
jgi:predicted transporter